jgi:uncharacterized protein YcfL
MFRSVMMVVLLLALMGCSSKEKVEVPKNTQPGPTSPPLSIGN